MRIRRLTLKNYANAPDLDIDVVGHVVLVGPNSSGKSSILAVLDACLNGGRAQLLSRFPVDSLRDEDEELIFEVIFHDFSPDETAALADEIAVAIDPSESTLTLRLTVSRSTSDPAETEVDRVFTQPGVQPVPVSGRHLEAIGWRLIRASRSSERDLSPSGSGALGQLLQSTDLGDDADSIATALAALDGALSSAESVTELRQQVAAALSSVLPGDVTDDMVNVGLRTDKSLLRSVDLAVSTTAGDRMRPLLEQSDGVRSLAVLSLRLLGQGGSGMTGIDEPETHLDTRSQARVGKLLSDPEGQRILATHSPIVLKQFAPADVVAMTATGARQFTSNIAERDRKFFSGWWVENMIEPLVSQSVILVEGPSDEILVRGSATASGIDLDRLGISIVNIGSANNFPNAYRLLGPSGFGIHVSSLVDVKEQHIVVKALGVETNELEANGAFTCDKDLEDVYISNLGNDRVVEMLADPAAGLGSVPETELYAKCEKYKVLAALGVSALITKAEVDTLTPITKLLTYATNASG